MHDAIVQSALDAIIVIDRHNRIIEFNSAAERVFGWQRAQVLGRDVADVVVPEEMRQRHRQGLAHHLATGEVNVLDRRLELTALRADGSQFPIELSVTRLGQGDNPIFAAFIRDITERQRLLGQLRRYTDRLAAIVEAQQELAASEASPDELLDRVAAVAQAVMAADGAVLELLEGDALVYRAVSGSAVGHLGRRPGLDSSLSGQALSEDRVLWCADSETDPRVDALAARAVGLRSMVVAVLRMANQPIGIIKVLAKRPHAFDESDAHAMELFTSSLGAVLQRKQAELERRLIARTQASIVAIQQEIATSDLALQPLMELMALRAQILTAATGGVVEWIDGQEMVYKAASGSVAHQAGLRIKRVGSLSGLCAEQGRALVCEDTETDARVDREACRRIHARAMAIAPLRAHDTIIGAIKVVSDRPGAFSVADVNNLQILVETLGSVIHRHRVAERLHDSEQQYRVLFNDNPHPMWVYDSDTLAFLAVNAAAVEQYGYSRDEFLAMSIRDIRPADALAPLEGKVKSLPAHNSSPGLWQHLRKNGETIDVEVTSDAIVFDGRPARLVLAHDVTLRRRAEAGQASANRALRMLSACNQAMVRIDDEARLLAEICRIIVEIGGYRMAGVGYAQDDAERSVAPMAFAGEHPEHANAIHLSWAEDSPYGQGPAGRAIRSGKAIAYPDLRDQHEPWRNAPLQMGYLSAVGLPLHNEVRTYGFLGMYSDRVLDVQAGELALLQELAENVSFGIAAIRAETDRRRIQAELAYSASHDVVTGLDRYSVLEPQMAQMLAAEGQFTAILLIDLDRFNGLNESMGHASADEVLHRVAGRIRDFASETVAIAHYAGDEFVVALSGGDAQAAIALAEAIRVAIARPIEGAGYRLLLTATIGISHSPAHGQTTLDLLRRAQAAMERGKSLGRDCICAFLTEHMQDIDDRMTLGGRLREAARAGELQLHYQPQFSADAVHLNGFEALLRWDNKELGSVSPARFIPIAEALGLMPEIGVWVLREACRQARVWIDAGHAGFNIAINVSAQQLQRPGLVRAVADALVEFAIPPDVLDIELTESSLMENVARVQGTLAELKALGVMLSLDDFGTGYSSLAYLKNFSLDKLKIDQSFVRGLPENNDDAAIARTIVSIGHQLRLLVAAEGVETQAQADFLREIGCDELQGYFHGRPGIAATAEAYFGMAG